MAPSLVVDLTGYGAHRQVEIHVPAASDLCTEGSVDSDRQNSISLTFQLPPVIMVDPYELDTALGKDVTLRLEGNLDLESPEVVSGWTTVGFRLPLQAQANTVLVPVHNKYGTPSTNEEDISGARQVTIPQPDAHVTCYNVSLSDSGGVPSHVAYSLGIESLTGLDWVIPVGSTSSVVLVGGVTQLVQVLCALFVTWICWDRLRVPGAKRKGSKKNE